MNLTLESSKRTYVHQLKLRWILLPTSVLLAGTGAAAFVVGYLLHHAPASGGYGG